MLLYRYWFVFFVFGGNFQVQAPGDHIRRGDLTEGFCVTSLGAYIWRGLFSEFYGNSFQSRWITALEIFTSPPHHRKRFRRRFFSQLHKLRLYLRWSFLHSAVQIYEIHILLFNIASVNFIFKRDAHVSWSSQFVIYPSKCRNLPGKCFIYNLTLLEAIPSRWQLGRVYCRNL